MCDTKITIHCKKRDGGMGAVFSATFEGKELQVTTSGELTGEDIDGLNNFFKTIGG